MGGQANFYINNCGDLRVVPAVSDDWSAFGQDGVFPELDSAVEKGLSKAEPLLFMQLTKAHPDSERLELFPSPSKELFAIITFQ
jgi:hypothetical protein